jgi:hypothetical protein
MVRRRLEMGVHLLVGFLALWQLNQVLLLLRLLGLQLLAAVHSVVAYGHSTITSSSSNKLLRKRRTST